MTIKINKELTSRDGGKIELGAIVTFQTIIPPEANEIHFDLKIFRNEASVKDPNVLQIYPIEFPSMGVVRKVQADQLANMTYNDYANILKEEIEALPDMVGTIELIGFKIKVNKPIEVVEKQPLPEVKTEKKEAIKKPIDKSQKTTKKTTKIGKK